MDALEMARASASWLFLLPVALTHELVHAAAATALGLEVYGAGVAYDDRGDWRFPIRVPEAFFVLREPAGDWRDPAVSFAPLAMCVPGLALLDAAPVAGGIFVLVGLTGLSDVHTELAGSPWSRGLRYWFVLGSPPAWQATLGRYR
jgi:hypothetical protein